MKNIIKYEIDKIYNKIDKIAKKGSENYLEYHIYFNSLVNNGKYAYLLETLENIYGYNISYIDTETARKESWKIILFKTNSGFQESKQTLLDRKGIYQSGLYYYKFIERTNVSVIDSSGKGAVLLPNIVGGGVESITVANSGSGYSASASIVISGGIGTASATPIIRQGKIYIVNIVATGSYHNSEYKLGSIKEEDIYENENKYKSDINNDLFNKTIGNKRTQLLVDKIGSTQSTTMSVWNKNFGYDKNVINLYSMAIDYLLT